MFPCYSKPKGTHEGRHEEEDLKKTSKDKMIDNNNKNNNNNNNNDSSNNMSIRQVPAYIGSRSKVFRMRFSCVECPLIGGDNSGGEGTCGWVWH